MKNFVKVLGLAAILAVAGCAHDDCYSCRDDKAYARPAPAPQPVRYAAPAPVCGGCQDEVRTYREPVEVIYKRTTQRTVYEPKTYQSVNYERESVRSADCTDEYYY